MLLTGHIQVGVGLDLSSFIIGKALEDSRVFWTQLLNVQASAGEHSVPQVLELAQGDSIFVPLEGGERDPWIGMEGSVTLQELSVGGLRRNGFRDSYGNLTPQPIIRDTSLIYTKKPILSVLKRKEA